MSDRTPPALTLCPRGFRTSVANVGIKDATPDFVCILSETPATVAGVFTQSRFAGPSVAVCRAHLAEGKGRGRAIVALSKNANVATGEGGLKDARAIVAASAASLGVQPEDIMIASTGVIGRRYPMLKILPHASTVAATMQPADFMAAARGIMTTDTVPKYAEARAGEAVITGIAKGVGMLAPNMATLLTFFTTDAALEPAALDAIFRRVMNRTFNCLSIDADTSTSDTAIILANGLAGPVEEAAFEAALYDVAVRLVKMVARDGEGATKRLEVTVDGAASDDQARRVARSIVNSPLVKTAVHGADPNWGRVAMAVGKCESDTDIDPDKVVIRFGTMEVYPRPLDENGLAALKTIMAGEDVLIHVSLGLGQGAATVWGCDLSSEYVHINADYTT